MLKGSDQRRIDIPRSWRGFRNAVDERCFSFLMRRGVQVWNLRVPQRNTVVMFGSDHGVFRARLFYKVCPVCRIVILCGESLGLCHVIAVLNFLVVKRPRLIYSFHRINSPVNEDPKFRILKPVVVSLRKSLSCLKECKQCEDFKFHLQI